MKSHAAARTLRFADVEVLGLTGRILWADGTPSPRPDSDALPGSEPRPGAEPLPGSDALPGAERISEPAYILIHGIGVSHRYLARLHAVLATHAPTYSLDLPGFANTPKPGRQLSVEDYGAFIAAALKSCGIESYVLVGHSMGAQFAIEAALQAPEQLTQLVLMGPVVDSKHKNVCRQSLALFLDGLLRESASSNWIVISDYFRCGLSWYLTELRVMMAYRTEERLAGVGVPLLVLRGSRDQVAGPDWSLRLSRTVTHGRLVEIPGVGHVAQHMRPEAVAEAIRSFVHATTPQR